MLRHLKIIVRLRGRMNSPDIPGHYRDPCLGERQVSKRSNVNEEAWANESPSLQVLRATVLPITLQAMEGKKHHTCRQNKVFVLLNQISYSGTVTEVTPADERKLNQNCIPNKPLFVVNCQQGKNSHYSDNYLPKYSKQ